jgi:hypothetical protein
MEEVAGEVRGVRSADIPVRAAVVERMKKSSRSFPSHFIGLHDSKVVAPYFFMLVMP